MSPLALIRWMISSPVHIRATGRARGTTCVRGQYVREVASIACPATGGHHPGYTVTELSSFALYINFRRTESAIKIPPATTPQAIGEHLFELLDLDESGTIDFREFLVGLVSVCVCRPLRLFHLDTARLPIH